MKQQHLHLVAALAALLFAAGHAAAQDATTDAPEVHTLGQHPAVLVKRQAPTLDTNRFILAHPAQLLVVDAPSPTYAHPAVAVARMALAAREAAELERNLAQPPVASAWLRRSPLAASVDTPASGS